MKLKRLLSVALAVLMLTALLTACAAKPSDSEPSEPAASDSAPAESEAPEETAEPVTLTYYSTSAEVNSMFEEMFADYHEINPNVTIELIPTGVGEGQSEKLQSLYASGNAPTFMNIDPSTALEYQSNLLPITEENAPWTDLLIDGAIEAGKLGGTVLGVPFSIQGYALLYNKRVVDEIYDGSFDPSTINTRDALQAFFEKIDAAGIPASLFHGANWSLGAHYLGMVYAVQGPATADGVAFIQGLMDGSIDIAQDPIFQGYMDTFDLIAKYNYNKADPLVGDYNKDLQAFSSGQCATFFMGDWSWTVITTLEEKDTEYGFIPVPWSNNPDDYGNTQVVMSMPKIMCVDASQSTPEQQQAALDALGWMLTTPEGQEYFIGGGFMMPYKNVREVEYNSMTQSIAEYAQAGKTINIGCFTYMTGDAWTQTGNLMLQYLAGDMTRDELAQGIDAYWQSVE
jgi:raffinose/stachyose/melibiose transport system substrate-binding protein